MPLTARQLYDYRDPTRAELLLVRAGHHLWTQIKRLRRKLGDAHVETAPLYAALETIWQAKREVKAEIKQKSAESFAKRFPERLKRR